MLDMKLLYLWLEVLLHPLWKWFSQIPDVLTSYMKWSVFRPDHEPETVIVGTLCGDQLGGDQLGDGFT